MSKSTIFECTIAPENQKKQHTLYMIFNVIKIIFLVLTVFYLIMAFAIDVLLFVTFFICLLISILFTFIQYLFYNFYDYTVVEDEIRISKLINNKLRRGVISFTTSKILKIGFVGGSEFQNLNTNNIHTIYAKNKNLKEVDVYFLITHNGEKKVVIFKFNGKFLSHVLSLTSNKVLDKDFNSNLKEYEKFNLS